jgi:hypothetical protein
MGEQEDTGRRDGKDGSEWRGERPQGRKLTPKQIRFCREYIVDSNGSAAARRAGYSEKHASNQACRLLAMPHVVAKLDELDAEVAADLYCSAKQIVLGLAAIALDGSEPASARVRAFELLGKRSGMFVDRQHHEGSSVASVVIQVPSNGREPATVGANDGGTVGKEGSTQNIQTRKDAADGE